MKKNILVASIFTLFMVFSSATTVRAEDDIQNFSNGESKFVKDFVYGTICDDYNLCVLDNEDIAIKKEKIYDVFLNKIGNIYTFSVKGQDYFGYLISRKSKVDNQWKYEVVEASTGVGSPFKDKSSKNIYVSYGNYLEYDGKNIVDEMNNLEYNYDEFMALFDVDILPSSIGNHEIEDHTEYYTYYTYGTLENVLDDGYPYLSTEMAYSWQSDNCSPTAGTSIIAYWDRYYTNLIPNYSPTYSVMVGYYPYYYYYEYHYKNWDNLVGNTTPDYSVDYSKIRSLHSTLYSSMYTGNWYIPFGINDDMRGTYPPFFVSGMRDYIESKGYEMHTVGIKNTEYLIFNLGPQNAIDWNAYVGQINLNRPVLMQLGLDPSLNYEMIRDINSDISIEEDTYLTLEYPYQYVVYYDTISMKYREDINMIHTVVGIGTKTYKYFKLDLNTGEQYLAKTDNYIMIANGWGGISYIKDDNIDIGAAYSIYVTN